MQPNEAAFLLSVLLPEIENEYAVTIKVLAAIPEDRREYRPDSCSRSAMDLAWHIVSSDIHFLEGVTASRFSLEEPRRPPGVDSIGGIIALYKSRMPDLIHRLRSMSGEQLAHVIDAGVFKHPAVIYLNFMIHHAVHHRACLCAYLRPMGAKVPAIYGPSYDETMSASATAS